MSAVSGHTAKQTATPWRTALSDTVGGLSVRYFITTYIAKYYSATLWRSAWRPDPRNWRPDPRREGTPPDRHTSRQEAAR